MAYERVLPDPVRARARMSREEERARGMRVDWMGVGVGNWSEERARRRRGCRAGSRVAKAVGAVVFAAIVVVVYAERRATKSQEEKTL